MEALIHSNERLDDLCRKGYRLIQDPKLFCFGIDAVLLSDYAKVKRSERAVDLCTGNGVIPILLEAKNNGEHYSGLELQPQCADLARRSVKYNHLEDKVTIEEGVQCIGDFRSRVSGGGDGKSTVYDRSARHQKCRRCNDYCTPRGQVYTG